MFFYVIAFQTIVEATKCGNMDSCESCVSTSSFGQPCRWCARDMQCHTPGAIGVNPCKMEENIVKSANCECASLFNSIKTRRNEIAKRVSDLIQDKLNLPATGPNSVAGHVQQLEDKQTNLRSMLLDFETRGCKIDTGDAWKYATRQAPTAAQVAKDNGITIDEFNKLAFKLGVNVLVLALVFAAPEIAGLRLLYVFARRFVAA